MAQARSQRLDAVNPATEEVFMTLPMSSEDDVAQVAGSARLKFESDESWRDPATRSATPHPGWTRSSPRGTRPEGTRGRSRPSP